MILFCYSKLYMRYEYVQHKGLRNKIMTSWKLYNLPPSKCAFCFGVPVRYARAHRFPNVFPIGPSSGDNIYGHILVGS